ncbi:MAG: efflux RND transporter periplasmic adaptor subunit [Gammaproteobacteria bacterium]
MNKRMLIMLVGCFILFGGIFGFKWFGKTMMNQYFDNMPFPPATITTATAKKDEWATVLEAVGTVKAINGINVTTQAAGIVESIEFESGKMVNAGELLVRLDAKTDIAQLNALQAAANVALLDLQRSKDLHRQNSVAKAEVDHKQSEADQATAFVNARKEAVAQKNIRAPFSGLLGIRQIDIGQYLSAGDPIVSLQMLDPIYINFSLPEQDRPLIQGKLPVQIALSGIASKHYNGLISAVEPGVDPNTRNFKLQATFDNPDHALRPGMFAKITIQLPQTQDVVVIPRTAINYTPYGNSVFVVQAKEKTEAPKQSERFVTRRFVKTGPERGDMVAILQGLEVDEVVATSGLLKLQNNTPVVINNEVTPSAEFVPHVENS